MTFKLRTTLQDHMRKKDIEVFKAAAQRYQVYILMRRTNPASLDYFGQAGYVPKRLDCKAKTADRNVTLPVYGEKQTAGLVVDPTIEGYYRAFKTYEKFQAACEEWKKFSKLLPPGEVNGVAASSQGGPVEWTGPYIPGCGFYMVQRNLKDPHYGCVMFSPSSLVAAASYVHGDYDLYDLVPVANPQRNMVWEGKMLGEYHNRGPQLFDIQHFANRNTGVPAVLHGSQAKFAKSHSDETVDVFYPDGKTVRPVEGRLALEELYRTQFKGRRVHHSP